MLQRWLFLAAACVATPVFAAGVTPLPEEVTEVVDCTTAGTIAVVKTDDGGDIRGGWWKTSDPDDVALCDLLAAGTFVDPSAFSDSNGATIIGTADGGAGGFPTVPVICKDGSTVQIQYRTAPVNSEGHGDACNSSGNRVWATFVPAATFWRISVHDSNGVEVWGIRDDGNFSFLDFGGTATGVQVLSCSDDGSVCCGWYTRAGDRQPFCCDIDDATDAFENCLTGPVPANDTTAFGEARCVSSDGSTVVVWDSTSDETFVTDPTDPSASLVKIADGQPISCNADGTVVIGFEDVGGDSIGWIWKDGERSDIVPTTGFDGTLPTCSNDACSFVGGVLTDGDDSAYIWDDGVHDAFPLLTACRDSLDLPFTDYAFDDTFCVAETARRFYGAGTYPGGDETCFYCELEDGPRFVWNEDARFYPPYITEYSFYAYFYSIYANALGGNAYTEIATAYGQYAYQYDAPCKAIDYDYWQRAAAVEDYEDARYTQFLFEYYCYVYNYYGPILGAQQNQYTIYAQNYSLYAATFLLEEL